MKKRIAWGMMSGGFGAALLFGMAVVVEGSWPSSGKEWWIYLWPAIGLVLGVWGWMWSRRLYRAEPPVPPAAWTVTLTDLIFATVFAGFCGAIFSTLDERFQRLVPAMGILGLAFYLHGALAASLRGIFGGWRSVFIVANIALTLGVMGWLTMALISAIVVAMREFEDVPRLWREVLFGANSKDWLMVIRVCVFALPVGVVVMRLMRWRMRAADVQCK